MISYGKTIVTAAGTYSIDKLLIETWLPHSFRFKFDDLENAFRYLGVHLQSTAHYSWTNQSFDSKVWVKNRFRFVQDGWDSGVIVELLSRPDPHYLNGVRLSDVQFGVRIMFNPNKHFDSDVVRNYFKWYSEQDGNGSGLSWRLRRVDYAFDVCLPILDVLMVSQKEASYYRGTRYFGQRGKSGYTRIYDKAKREKEEGPLTRFEWEQHNEEDIVFDPPLMLGDLPSGYSWLKYIKFECVNECLADMDKRTRKKIKDYCFKPIDFDPGIFRGLLLSYIQDLGLSWDNHILTEKEYYELVGPLVPADVEELEAQFYE